MKQLSQCKIANDMVWYNITQGDLIYDDLNKTLFICRPYLWTC